MIAGSYDDMQGGICYGGIAHAGPVRYQRAMWGDGTNDYVQYNINPFAGLTNWTCYQRMFPHRSRVRGVSSRIGTSSDGVEISYSLTRTFSVIGNPNIATTTAYPLSLWYDVCVTYGAGIASIYIDKALAASGASTISAGENMRIGLGSNYYMHGINRDILIFDRVLSPSEIADPRVVTDGRVFATVGSGVDPEDWRDTISSQLPTVYGSPVPAYIRGDGGVFVNGEHKNP